ncbi:MAG TPA: hypothetical protein VMG81_02770 [Thermoplasmata archaeon]|nr:hypothetical protein [Thermoplasmata archaeon]
MGDSREEAQFREHLREMRRAAGGLSRDFASEFSDLDRKIERFGRATAQDARDLGAQIQEDFSNLGKNLDTAMRAFPRRVADAGIALGSGMARAGGATRDAMVVAGKKAKESTKNALASAAGVRRTPMREWAPPVTDTAPMDEDR